MRCCRCRRVALYQVNSRGYCRAHRDEARAAQVAAFQRADSGLVSEADKRREFVRAKDYSRNYDQRERDRLRWKRSPLRRKREAER